MQSCEILENFPRELSGVRLILRVVSRGLRLCGSSRIVTFGIIASRVQAPFHPRGNTFLALLPRSHYRLSPFGTGHPVAGFSRCIWCAPCILAFLWLPYLVQNGLFPAWIVPHPGSVLSPPEFLSTLFKRHLR